jgi:hypothetical protein
MVLGNRPGWAQDLPEEAREWIRRRNLSQESWKRQLLSARRSGRRQSLIEGAGVMAIMAICVYPRGHHPLPLLAALLAGLALGWLWDRLRAGPDRSFFIGLPFHLGFVWACGLGSAFQLLFGGLLFICLCCTVGATKEGRLAAGFDVGR